MIDLKSVSSHRVVCYMSCIVVAVQRVACCMTCRGCRLHLINVKSVSPFGAAASQAVVQAVQQWALSVGAQGGHLHLVLVPTGAMLSVQHSHWTFGASARPGHIPCLTMLNLPALRSDAASYTPRPGLSIHRDLLHFKLQH